MGFLDLLVASARKKLKKENIIKITEILQNSMNFSKDFELKAVQRCVDLVDLEKC